MAISITAILVLAALIMTLVARGAPDLRAAVGAGPGAVRCLVDSIHAVEPLAGSSL